MTNRLEEVLSGNEGNYILPFLWQRGEEESVIREEMARVYASGIRAVCVEARPHPDFLGPRWWRDMDIIMEEARSRGMRVWMLDDDHFPTGHAAGKLVNGPAELRRLFLQEQHMDAVGPQRSASFLIKPWRFDSFIPSPVEDGSLVAVIAARRDAASGLLAGDFLDLTACVHDDILYWDIPDGYWRIFTLYSTPSGGSKEQMDYVNPIVPESVRVLIDTVYEPFYERYPADFGQTFAGFFSDEPGFYNDKGYDYHSALGKEGVALPWRRDMLELLAAQFGEDYRKCLPLLWHMGGELTSAVRFTYMDVVSRLYGEHFTGQLGNWCRSYGVEYIGHVIEDNGNHARLGSGTGHYFRALWGQDMAGLDVVLWQLAPGFDQGSFTNVSGNGDGEFYHYGLAKMGSSLGHIDPKKKGRTMCEVFGAYGWREGLKLMKWMTDHMLVRGVNYFVPHAFSQADFPDPDCPPHLYARGKNPQYRYYRELNLYTNRASHLLTGGLHIAPVAVLYHAEAEWCGGWMPFHAPLKALLQSQIDCDVLPGDSLIESAVVADGNLEVAGESYRCLVVPYSEVLPGKLLSRLVELADQGLPLLFVDRLPVRSFPGPDSGKVLARLSDHNKVHTVPLPDLAGLVKRLGYYEVSIEGSQPYLRYYHIRHPGMDVFMFSNEHPFNLVKTNVILPGNGRALAYDAFTNQISQLACTRIDESLHFPLELSPYQSILIVTGEGVQGLVDSAVSLPTGQTHPGRLITGPWSIATAVSEQYPAFTAWRDAVYLADLSQPDSLPAFSGTFRYETEFEWLLEEKPKRLDLGEVFETAEVWMNGQRAGVRICPPYRFDIGDLVVSGKNRLVVEVTNTLAKEQRDFLSRFAQQEPSGLLGPVLLV